jgi:hypothetical protein
LRPEVPERLQPPVDVLQRSGLDGVEAARALRPHTSEAALAEHSEVLGDGGLRDAELRADHVDDVSRRPLPVDEQLEDPPADRVTEDVERVHEWDYISGYVYKSSLISCCSRKMRLATRPVDVRLRLSGRPSWFSEPF